MSSQQPPSHHDAKTLKAYFLPYLTPSHFLPLFQIAKFFASRGVHVTFLTTPHTSLLYFQDAVAELAELGYGICLDLVEFPSREVGLPEGVESFSDASTRETSEKVLRAFFMLQKPMENRVRAARPDFIVADMHCFWASDLGIPRPIFHHRAYFALGAADSITRYAPHQKVGSDSELFLLPGLPDPIRMARSEFPHWIQSPNHPYSQFVEKVTEGDHKSYGVLVSSFYELEKPYADYYRAELGRRAWCIGPLPIHCDTAFQRSGKTAAEAHKHPCLEWLDNMPPGKVVYVGFGSISVFSQAQLFEIACGLESSGHPFVWVVRKQDDSGQQQWLPDGFETRITEQKKGVLIKGWAPQVAILEHPAVGGFVTHCGWNSLLEGVTAGLPVVAWPLSAKQFYNRRLVMDGLKIGVDIGTKKWGIMIEQSEEVMGRERIEKAVRELMGDDEEAVERRRRAAEFGSAAKKAVEKGGSSYENLTAVIDELQRLKG